MNSASFHRKAAFVLSFLLAVYCWATARRTVRWESTFITSAMLMVLAWIYLSLFWSMHPGETSRELVRVTVYAALAYGLAIRFQPLELMRILLIASIASVLTSIAWEVVVGTNMDGDGVYRLHGSLHPNPMGRFLLIIGVIALKFAIDVPTERTRWLLLLFACLVVLALTRSRTALASVIAALTATFFVGRELQRLVLPVAVGAVGVAMLVLAIGLQGESGVTGAGNVAAMGRSEKVGSLTGRFPLWEAIIERTEGHELLGFGYGAFWNAKTNRAMLDDVSWFPGHAHNGYLESYVNIGLVGVLLLVVTGLAALRRTSVLAYRGHGLEYAILVGLIVGVFVNNLAESGFVLPRELAIFTALLGFVAAQAPAEAKHAKSSVAINNRSFPMPLTTSLSNQS